MGPDRETVLVYYDFASTIAYVAHRVIGRMSAELERLGLELEWRPIDLARLSGWKPGVEVEGPRRENALRVARELGVDVRMPAVWLDSRRAHAVAFALAGDAKEIAWRERVWSGIFEEGRDVGDPTELARLGDDLDLDVEGLAAGGELARLERETRAANERGVSGVPSFLLGDFPFAGIQEPATMLDLFSRWVEKRSGSS